MHYEINVSRHGKHVFATAERSLTTKDSAIELYQKFRTIFTDDEGYEITVTRYTSSGETLHPEELA